MESVSSLTDPAALPEGIVASQRAPHALYLTGEDNLRVTVFNAAAGVTVAIRGRFENLAGIVVPFSDSVVPTTTRTASTVTIRLGEGWLLGAAVFVSAGSPLTAQTFAIVSVIRGEGSAALDLMTLAAGPITAQQRVGYPGSSIANSLDSGGAIRSIAGSAPGAGIELSETVPTGARWELLAFTATLTTNVTVANRFVKLTCDDGATVYFRVPHGSGQAASTVYSYCFFEGAGITTYADPGAAVGGLPVNNRLLAAHRIRTVTTNLQAGDQWSAVQYLVKEWLEAA
jgi:hypothetical protein